MTGRDTRPLHSPMPEHLARVYDDCGLPLSRAVLAVFHRAMIEGAHVPKAERQNDAFSLAYQVMSVGLLALAAEMARRKGVPEEAAVNVLLADLEQRTRFNLELLRAAAAAGSAVKQ